MRMLLALLTLGSALSAQSTRSVVQQVIEAFERGDDLKPFAARDDVDPWVVADFLICMEKKEAAQAFAKAAPRPDTALLPAFVAKTIPARDPRIANQKADAARERREFGNAHRLLDDADPGGDLIARIYLEQERGYVYRDEGRWKESVAAFLSVAEKAREIGWLKKSSRLLYEAAKSAEHRDVPQAIELGRRALSAEEERKAGDSMQLADTLSLLARVVSRSGDVRGAMPYMERALRVYRARKSDEEVAVSSANLMAFHRELGEVDEAIAIGRQALEIVTADYGRMCLLLALGAAFDDVGRYDDALEHHQRAYELAKKVAAAEGKYAVEATQAIPLALGNLAISSRNRGDGSRQREYLTESLRVAEQTGIPETISRSLRALAALYTAEGDAERALNLLDRAVRLSRAVGATAETAQSLRAMAAAHVVEADLALGLARAEESRQLLTGLDRPSELATTLHQIGFIQVRLGRYAEALAMHEQARDLIASSNRSMECTAYYYMGQAQNKLGRPDDALRSYQRARELCPETDVARRAKLDVAMAAARLDGQEYGPSRSLLQTALEQEMEAGDRVWAVHCLCGALSKLGEPEQALKLALDTLPLARDTGPYEAHRILTEIARLYIQDLKREREAVPYLNELIASNEMLALGLRGFSDEHRMGALDEFNSWWPYHCLAYVECLHGTPAGVFAHLESARARTVLDLLARSRIDPVRECERRLQEQGRDERLAALRQAREALQKAQLDVQTCAYALSQKQLPDKRVALTANLEAARGQLARAVLARTTLVRELLPVAKPAALETIQQHLAKDERLLFFATNEGDTLLIIVPPSGGEPILHELLEREKQPLTCEMLAKLVGEWRAHHADRARSERGVRPAAGRSANGEDPGARLLDLLMPPQVREQLEGVKRLIVVPQGPLHELPLEALPSWLGKLPPVSYAHSASVFLWTRQRRRDQRAERAPISVLALGDPVFSREQAAISEPPEAGVLVARGNDAISAGDVILRYDDEPVPDPKALGGHILAAEEKEQVTVRVWRAGEEIDVTVPGGPLGVEVAKETPRVAWAQLREQSLLTLQRSAAIDSFGPLAPLPGTRREVRAIGTAVPGARMLLGEQATKTALHRLAPQARFLHLATHQLADEARARGHSRIALTVPRLVTPEDDGFLSLFDLFEDWRDRLSGCELVVLSACETGTGPLHLHEGPYAMPLGFLYAGAPAVIGSLWRVNDASTAELFADFYIRLAKGTPKLQAFTEARLELKKKYPDPYHWGAFIYIGDPR